MAALVKEDNLTAFLTGIGFSSENLATLPLEDLSGFTSAILDYEARLAQDPNGKEVFGHNGYMGACKSLAKHGAQEDDETGYGTLFVRLAEQNIARLLAQMAELASEDDDNPGLLRAVLALLFACGLLINLMNTNLTTEQCKLALKGTRDRMVEARRSLEDVKKAMREQGVQV